MTILINIRIQPLNLTATQAKCFKTFCNFMRIFLGNIDRKVLNYLF